MAGELVLLPNLLSEKSNPKEQLPENLGAIFSTLDGLIVENAKSARRFIVRFSRDLLQLPMETLNEHTQNLKGLLSPMKKGEKWGLLSEAGLTCIADPGAKLVELVRKQGISVRALPGPSSIFMGLMLSGFSGQSFTFHGYLPRRRPLLDQRLEVLVRRSQKEGTTQIFIEAPYRNNQLFATLLELLPNDANLCVACDLTDPNEWVETLSVSLWKKRKAPDLHKRPTLFLFNSILDKNFAKGSKANQN
ncbi:MAG: SAM-dependent methyltransferase [Candidatus Algichlamydia australiensis]|nr:SAM-dependent methyltransferase [Chlamydiales bacterium]